MKVTETDARKGKFALLKTKDETFTVSIRCINDQDDWLEGASDVIDLEAKIDPASNTKENRQAKRDWESAVIEAVFAYDEELSARREELETKFTKIDFINAFMELVNELDPFVAMQKKKRDEGLEVFKTMPPQIVDKFMARIDSGALEL